MIDFHGYQLSSLKRQRLDNGSGIQSDTVCYRESSFAQDILKQDEIDSKLGFHLFPPPDPQQQQDDFNFKTPRLGWLLTFSSGVWKDQDDNDKIYSCVDLCFLSQDGSKFKCKYKCRPYFYLVIEENMHDIRDYLLQRYEGKVSDIEIVDKVLLYLKEYDEEPAGEDNSYLLKMSFDNIQHYLQAEKEIAHLLSNKDTYGAQKTAEWIYKDVPLNVVEGIDFIAESTVPYHVRFAIDSDVRCGQWYDISASGITGVTLEKRLDILQPPQLLVCAFHVQTTRKHKPGSRMKNMVTMISYMVDGKGYLIVNAECVGENIEDFEYSPRLGFEGRFHVEVAANEKELLRGWFSLMRVVKPDVYVTYNGKACDWAILDYRAAYYGIQLNDEIGFHNGKFGGGYVSKFACHIDCYAWVAHNNCFPGGIRCHQDCRKAMVCYPWSKGCFLKDQPKMVASYCVSEVFASYFLYQTCVRPFIFSLATKVPLPPDDVLCTNNNALCELYFRSKANRVNFIFSHSYYRCPKFPCCHLLDSEACKVDNVQVDEIFKEYVLKANEMGNVIPFVSKMYSEMRAEHYDCAKSSILQAVKSIMHTGEWKGNLESDSISVISKTLERLGLFSGNDAAGTWIEHARLNFGLRLRLAFEKVGANGWFRGGWCLCSYP